MQRHISSQRYVQLIMTFTAGLWLLFALSAAAQTQYGSITGRVVDKSGAALPGVTVTISGNGAPLTFVSDAQGQYRFLNLSPGMYSMEAQLEGMGSVKRRAEVTVGNNAEIQLMLSPTVSESITVTAATPVLDRRRTGTAENLQEVELKSIPNARDPWVVLQTVPGVLVDRVNVGGNKSGQQSYFVGKGVERNQTNWNLDGVQVSDMQATGTSGFYYDFDSFQEMNISTGTVDPAVQTPGVQINMVTKRGTNDLRGSGRWFWTDQSLQSTPTVPTEAKSYLTQVQSIDQIDDYGLEAGGPLVRDKLWFWGAYSKNDINNLVASGSTAFQKYELKNYNAKINYQPMANNSASAYYMYSDKFVLHRGIGPKRPVETSRNQSGPGWVYKFEDTHNFDPTLYLSARVGIIHNGYVQDPVGGTETNVYWDQGGSVPHGSYSFYSQKTPQQNYRGEGSKYFNTAALNHELKFGFGYRNTPAESITAWPGDGTWVEFYNNPDDNRVAVTRDARPKFGSKYKDVFLGDTILMGNLTLTGGLRYDDQSARNEASEVAANRAFPDVLPAVKFSGDPQTLRWKSVSPRIGATYALGSTKQTILRTSYSRYVDQLGSGQVGPNNPFYHVQILYYYWEDVNGDRRAQRNEFRDFSDALFVSPSNPGSTIATGRLDYNMKPTKTDEYQLGVEREIMPAFSVGANYSYRKRTNFLWDVFERTQGKGDYLTSADFIPVAAPVTGTLPNGDPYSVSYYRKKDTATATYTVTTNRPDYYQTYNGLELTATKRMENNWMLRANVTLSDWKQHVGPRGSIDPSPILSGFSCISCTGAPVASAGGEDGYINSRWSFSVNTVYQFRWGITAAASVTGREGYIEPYYRRINSRDGLGNRRILVNGFGNDRLDNVYEADFRLAKQLASIKGVGITLSADLFNAMNDQTVLWRDNRLYSANGADVAPGNNWIIEQQSPRVWRIGARLNF